MIRRQTIFGKVVSVGRTFQQDGSRRCYLVDVVVLENDAGGIMRLIDVVVPCSIHWMLEVGEQGQFEFLYVQYPKPFGSYLRCFLIGLRSKRGNVQGAPDVQKWMRASRGAALHFFGYGLILMPAFGLGLLFWICAVRLVMVNLPDLHVRS